MKKRKKISFETRQKISAAAKKRLSIPKNNPNYSHGMRWTRFYKCWQDMKARCQRPKCVGYKNYGARGIKVCLKWQKFIGFMEDMKSTYSDNLELDRINVNGNYSKKNCRWATSQEQALNKRPKISFKNESSTTASKRLGGSNCLVRERLYAGWPIEKAFTVPVSKK